LRKYESIFILNERKFDDAGAGLSKRIEEILKELGATYVEANNLGRKQFARAINKKTHGVYWSIFFNLDPARVEEYEDKFRLEENILRHVVFSDDRPEGELRTLKLDQ